MMNKTILALSVSLALGLAACGKAPEPAANQTQAVAEVGSADDVEIRYRADEPGYPGQATARFLPLCEWQLAGQNGNLRAISLSRGSFNELRDSADQHVLTLIKAAAAKPAEAGSDTQKTGDLYRSYLDTAKIEALGIARIGQRSGGD